MATKKRNPKWWQVYLGLPLLVGLFWLEMQIPLTDTENVIAQLGILCLIFAFMQVWIRANRSALMHMDDHEGEWRVHLYHIPAEQSGSIAPSEDRRGERPMLHIPASGLKGVLSDTFEWESPEDETSVFADRSAVPRKE